MTMQPETHPFVCVIVPCRNEERHISDCLSSLLSQTYSQTQYEVIVVDGQSSDRSADLVRKLQDSHVNLRWLDNPLRTAPSAMNIGIRSTRAEIIIRADAHNTYPRNYIENSVKCLNETGADNVGGPWITVPADDSLSARLVALVLSNPFGVGNARFRVSDKEGFVDTVPFGCFRRQTLERLGLLNETLIRNQDIDLNARIRKSGGKIYLSPTLTTQYHPVRSFRALLEKAFKDQMWHVLTVRENWRALGLRHFVPFFFLLTILFLALTGQRGRVGLAVVLGIYFAAALYFSLARAKKHGIWLLLVMPFAFLTFHLAYGAGTLAGFSRLWLNPAQDAPPGAVNTPLKSTTTAKVNEGLPRGVEALMSTAGLIVLAPVFGVVSALIAITSGRPILFRQERVGRNGSRFVLYKFRTMRPSKNGTCVTADDDIRITRLGRFLRETKLDELPELWNVLMGDMSLVGARPEVPDYVDLNSTLWQEVLKTRPGLTHPVTLALRNEQALIQQVSDGRELFYRRILQPFKLKGYLAYSLKRTWRTDLRVLCRTLYAIFVPGSAPPPTMQDLFRDPADSLPTLERVLP